MLFKLANDNLIYLWFYRWMVFVLDTNSKLIKTCLSFGYLYTIANISDNFETVIYLNINIIVVWQSVSTLSYL